MSEIYTPWQWSRLRFKPAALNRMQAAGQWLGGKFQMLLPLGLDAEQRVIFSHGAKRKEMKGAAFGVHGFLIGEEANQTLAANGSHIRTQWCLARRYLSLITTSSLRVAAWWMRRGEQHREGKEGWQQQKRKNENCASLLEMRSAGTLTDEKGSVCLCTCLETNPDHISCLGCKDTDMWAKGFSHAGYKWPCLRSSLQGCLDEEGRRCERLWKQKVCCSI